MGQFKNIISGNIENLDSTISESPVSDMKFLWLAPHSGTYIPDYTLPLLSRKSNVFGEMFKDGDPGTNNFNFEEIGGYAIHTKIHRDISDSNRPLDSPTFIREYSFDNKPIVTEKVPPLIKEKLKGLTLQYWDRITSKITDFKKMNPGSPLYLISIHSMDSVAGSSYENENKNRPEMSIILGNHNGSLFTKFYEGFKENMPDYDVQFNHPFSKLGYIGTNFKKDNVYPIVIEINKSLFMDEQKINQNKFNKIQNDLRNTFAKIIYL